MKSNNYVTIQGWMLNDLGIEDIREVFIYAIIYGFSQDEKSEFTGSLKYLSETAKCTVNTAKSCLNKLVEKGLIMKNDVYINQVKFVKYRCENIDKVYQNLTGGIANFDMGVYQNLSGGISKIDNNNTNYNTNINNSNIDREQKFKNEVDFHKNLFGSDKEIENFKNYWTEKNKKNKMRFENEPFFEISKRISTWNKRSTHFNNQKAIHKNTTTEIDYSGKVISLDTVF